MMPGVERPAFNLQCLAFTLGGTVLAVIHDHILTIMAIQFSKSRSVSYFQCFRLLYPGLRLGKKRRRHPFPLLRAGRRTRVA